MCRHSERSEVRFSIARFPCDESLFERKTEKERFLTSQTPFGMTNVQFFILLSPQLRVLEQPCQKGDPLETREGFQASARDFLAAERTFLAWIRTGLA